MKLFTAVSAALLVAAVTPVAATAQRHDRVVSRTVVHTERHRGYRNHTRQVCRVVYRNHHRQRVCRTVRY